MPASGFDPRMDSRLRCLVPTGRKGIRLSRLELTLCAITGLVGCAGRPAKEPAVTFDVLLQTSSPGTRLEGVNPFTGAKIRHPVRGGLSDSQRSAVKEL